MPKDSRLHAYNEIGSEKERTHLIGWTVCGKYVRDALIGCLCSAPPATPNNVWNCAHNDRYVQEPAVPSLPVSHIFEIFMTGAKTYVAQRASVS